MKKFSIESERLDTREIERMALDILSGIEIVGQEDYLHAMNLSKQSLESTQRVWEVLGLQDYRDTSIYKDYVDERIDIVIELSQIHKKYVDKGITNRPFNIPSPWSLYWKMIYWSNIGCFVDNKDKQYTNSVNKSLSVYTEMIFSTLVANKLDNRYDNMEITLKHFRVPYVYLQLQLTNLIGSMASHITELNNFYMLDYNIAELDYIEAGFGFFDYDTEPEVVTTLAELTLLKQDLVKYKKEGSLLTFDDNQYRVLNDVLDDAYQEARKLNNRILDDMDRIISECGGNPSILIENAVSVDPAFVTAGYSDALSNYISSNNNSEDCGCLQNNQKVLDQTLCIMSLPLYYKS